MQASGYPPGVLVNKLPELLKARDKSIFQVAQETGLAYGTVRHLVLDHSDRFDKKTLDTLCAYFGVQLNEIFEFVPTPPDPGSSARKAA